MYAYQGITVRPELKKKRMQEVSQSKSDSANYTKGQDDKKARRQEQRKKTNIGVYIVYREYENQRVEINRKYKQIHFWSYFE